jgi:serpin B
MFAALFNVFERARSQPDPSSPPPTVAAASTRFGIKLLHRLTAQQPDQNVFISPASVSIALAMTRAGARGETEHAIAAALEAQGLSAAEFAKGNAELLAQLQNAGPGVELAVANSLWGNRQIRFHEEFLRTAKQSYGAELTSLDFARPETVSTINRWVKSKTRERIPHIVDRLAADDLLVLINAVYFKGTWYKPFDRAATREADFTLPGGGKKKVRMMSRFSWFNYLRGKKFQAVRLPYGQGRVSFYVFLPDQNSNLREFLRQLTPANWEAWLAGFHSKEGELGLPRFRAEYEAELGDPLRALGMEVAFDRKRADFSGMVSVPPGAFIGAVRHKTFVEVNEEGTEAAASTAVTMQPTAAPPVEEPFKMIMDRPFFCAIRDQQTGAVLFLGAISDPQ